MDNNQNEQHEKIKKRLKIIGGILLGVGICLTAIGLFSFFSAFGGNGTPDMFWCAFLGLPTLGIAGSLLNIAYRREFSRYMKNETTPVINEASEDLAPAIKNVVAAIKDGSQSESNGIACGNCGKINDIDSRFCANCGKTLTKIYPNCKEAVDPDSAFCNHCGQKLS